jgi:hypothetical protein
MFSFIRKYWSREKAIPKGHAPLGQTWSEADDRIHRPSEEDFEAQKLKSEDPNTYVSDSFTDPSNRGGPLGAENDMPDGGDSTRGMSQGPSSKSPMPQSGSGNKPTQAAS